MNKLRGLHSNASLNSVKKKKSLKNKESSNSLSPNASSPIGAEGGVSELSEPGRLKFSWTRSEAIDCGLVCGQSATWGNTVYFKNGGTSDLYEYSYRYGGREGGKEGGREGAIPLVIDPARPSIARFYGGGGGGKKKSLQVPQLLPKFLQWPLCVPKYHQNPLPSPSLYMVTLTVQRELPKYEII